MLYLIYRQHQDLTYKGGEGPIVHLEADLHATVQWANAQARRWAFTLSDAGSNYFEDRADLARLHEINWDAVAAQSWSSCKEPKQAEFLLEQSFPWHLIEQIGVQSRQIYTQVAKKKGTNLFSTFSRPDGPLLADSGYHQRPLSAILRTQRSYSHAISSLFILQVICVHVSKLSLSVAILICLNLGYCYPALFE